MSTEGRAMSPSHIFLCFAVTWEYCAGFISAGNNVAGYQGKQMTPKAAEQECQGLSSCFGYTFSGSGNASAPTSVWLKEKWDCIRSSGWHAYRKPSGSRSPVSFRTLSVALWKASCWSAF